MSTKVGTSVCSLRKSPLSHTSHRSAWGTPHALMQASAEPLFVLVVHWSSTATVSEHRPTGQLAPPGTRYFCSLQELFLWECTTPTTDTASATTENTLTLLYQKVILDR